MITTNYKDYEITVSKSYTNLGFGYRVAFSIQKDGNYENVRIVESFRPGISPDDIINGVKRLIDENLF